MVRFCLVVMMLMCTGPALAGAPVTGRTQHMLFSRDLVQAEAAKTYYHRLSQLASKDMLDTDKVALKRVRRICSRLIAQAVLLKPAAADWQWEVHTTSDPQVAAYSMEGGKLMVGLNFIKRYKLNDNELAVALAHEIGHVIAEHVREQVSQAASFEPKVPNRKVTLADVVNSMESDIAVYFRLQPLSRLQEMEADDIGIELAARAGVSPSSVVSFYNKIARKDGSQSIFDTHGDVTQRVTFVESMAGFVQPIYQASQGTPLPSYTFVSTSIHH